MMRNVVITACTVLLAFGLSLGSFAGSVTDSDSDGVPDVYDNCVNVQNGPLGGPCAGQEDEDLDGYGNACDADLNNSGTVGANNIADVIAAFNTADPLADFNCSGTVGANNIAYVIGAFNTNPGPSGLACAGVSSPCVAQ